MVDILSVFWIVLDREWTSATALAQRGSAKGSAGAEAETGTLGWTDLDEEIYEIETMCHPVDRKSPDSIFGWCSSWANLKAIWLYTPGFQDEKEPSDMFTIVHHIKQTWSKQTFNAPKRTHSKLSMWKYTVPKNGASFFLGWFSLFFGTIKSWDAKFWLIRWWNARICQALTTGHGLEILCAGGGPGPRHGLHWSTCGSRFCSCFDTFYELIRFAIIRIDTYWISSLFGTILDPSQHDWDLVWGPLYRSSRGGGILALEIAEIYLGDRWRLEPGPILELQRGIIGHHVSHHLTAQIHIL